MPPLFENVAVQGQLQDLRYVDMGFIDMANDDPPLHEHRDHAINNYVGVAQAQAAPPPPVCTDLDSLYTLI